MKKFVVLIEDDFEVMGNGLGNVAHLQYLPALSLINIANKYNVKITFMVDVAHQLVLRANMQHPEIRVQAKLWDETVLLLKEYGHDIQLHLHPQWLNAKYENGHFYLSDNWNLGRCTPIDQHRLITESVEYLNNLLVNKFPEYKVCAYKAGSWGMQPSSNLQAEFEKVGINIMMGVRQGLEIPSQGVDYTCLEEAYLPYYPDSDNLQILSDKVRNLAVIPLQSYDPDLITFSRYMLNQVITKYRYQNNLRYYSPRPIPDEVKNLNPLKGKSLFKLGLRPYSTHLKIGNQSFSYLKKSFDTVIRRLEEIDADRIPILIESHTKQYRHHYHDIEKFLAYVSEKYESSVEFSDLSGFSQEIKENPELVRYRSEN